MTDAFTSANPAPAPWTAEAFQVKRYGTRYYGDTLPACPIAEPTKDTWPGFSSIKGHKPFKKSVMVDGVKRVVPLDLYTAWQFMQDRHYSDTQYTDAEFFDCVNVSRDRSFARGHAIHAAAEATLLGTPIPQWALANTDAAPYIPHAVAWIHDNVESVIAIEAVVINRTLGYGGTGDAWLRLRSGVDAYVDWKSRGEDSSHGIYDEEIAQGGAYTGAEYMIGPNAGRTAAVRLPLPTVTHGVVVSIRPDGCETFYYDPTIARDVFGHMLAAYRSTSSVGKTATKAKKIAVPASTANAAVEQPATEGTTSPSVATIATGGGCIMGYTHGDQCGNAITSINELWCRDHDPIEAHRQQLRERCRIVAGIDPNAAAVMASTWPFRCPRLTDDDLSFGHLAEIEAHIARFETATSAPFAEPVPVVEDVCELCLGKAGTSEDPCPRCNADNTPPTLPDTQPDEGITIDATDPVFARMQERYARLDAAGMTFMQQVIGESIRAGRSIHMGTMKSLRRVRIVDGLVALALAEVEEFARDLTAIVTGCEAVHFPTVPLGAAVSLMNAVEAATFAELCDAYVADSDAFVYRDGHLSLRSAA